MAGNFNRYVPDWSVTSNPGAGNQATVSRAASTQPLLAESKHVCTYVSATLVAAAATAAQGTVNLRDGASGAGTILGSWVIAVPATIGSTAILAIGPLEVIGSPNTAMTLEFSAAIATQVETVTMTGHTISGPSP